MPPNPNIRSLVALGRLLRQVPADHTSRTDERRRAIDAAIQAIAEHTGLSSQAKERGIKALQRAKARLGA